MWIENMDLMSISGAVDNHHIAIAKRIDDDTITLGALECQGREYLKRLS